MSAAPTSSPKTASYGSWRLEAGDRHHPRFWTISPSGRPTAQGSRLSPTAPAGGISTVSISRPAHRGRCFQWKRSSGFGPDRAEFGERGLDQGERFAREIKQRKPAQPGLGIGADNAILASDRVVFRASRSISPRAANRSWTVSTRARG
jgi:hypothetical protein